MSVAPSLGRAFEATFEDTARRYRIVLGDSCSICRAGSRITFTRDRLPTIPMVGCREKDGCRCALPDFDEEQEAPPPAAPSPVADATDANLPEISVNPILEVDMADEVVTTDEQDARVFGVLCDQALVSNTLTHVDVREARSYPDLQDFTDEEYKSSLVSLVKHDWISLTREGCAISEAQFDQFVTEAAPNLESIVQSVAQRLSAAAQLPRPERWIAESPRLAENTREPQLIIEHVLRRLYSEELIVIENVEGGTRVVSVTLGLRQRYGRSGKLWAK